MDSQQSLPAVTAIAPQASTTSTVEAPAHAYVAAGLWRRRLATPATFLALVLISLAFFWKVVILRQVLLPADVLYAHDPLWHTLMPRGFTQAANPLDSDALTEFYPWTALAATALHHGVVPLWNPYAFDGTPFLGAMQTAVFYPVNLILGWLLPPADVLGWRAVIHLAIATTGTFVFARRLRLSRSAALLSALAFGFGLPNVVWLEHPMAGAVAWLPWLLLGIEGAVAAERRMPWVAGLAATVAVEILAGHGESTVHAFLLCGAYAAFRLVPLAVRRPRAVVGPVVGLIVALGLGIAVSAAYLLPTLAQVPLSEAAADRAAVAPFGALGDPALWTTAVVAVIPDFFGNPTWHNTVSPDGQGYNELALYVGAIPLFLALVALGTRRAPVVFFAATALIALGMALRLPVIGLLDNLPVLRLAADGRLRFEYAFAVAILAGFGLDALGSSLRGAWLWAGTWLLLVCALASLAVAGLNTIPPTGDAAAALLTLRAALPALWCALFVGLLWLRRRGIIGMGILSGVTLALVAADLGVSGGAYHTTLPSSSVAAVPPAINAVQRDHTIYRVAGLGSALLPSLSSLYALQDIRGYDPAYAATYERAFGEAFGVTPGMRLGLPPFGPSPAMARMLDLMGVKYLFAACSIPLNERYYRPVFQGSGCVYRNLSALPRVTLVHNMQWAAPVAAIGLLREGRVDPRQTVLLDPATRGDAAWRLSPAVDTIADEARISRYGLDDVTVSVRSRGTAALVLTDAFAPGWHAAVDGHDQPIARADGIFRAVLVAPGRHTVTFWYQPRPFIVGAVVSVVALGLWLLLSARALAAAVRARARVTTAPAL